MKKGKPQPPRTLLLAALLAFACSTHPAQAAAPALPAVSAAGIPAFSEDMLDPEYWIGRQLEPDVVLLDARQAAARRARAFAPEGGLTDLQQLPATLSREQVSGWIGQAELTRMKIAFDDQGKPVGARQVEALRRNAAAGKVAASTQARYGLSVRRTSLRTLPSARVFHTAADLRDYDSLQSGILFPGEPVVIAHRSADGRWLLAMSTQGPGWVLAEDIAEGAREEVFGYAAKAPARVVTGDQVRTVFTPEAPELSELLLDMGTALPAAEVPPGEPVNGASPYASWPLLLPVRGQGGKLEFRPALLRRSADSAPAYLPLTRANILRQAFKFLGERYGWGHQFNARDCSGLTSDIYRSLGLLVPPNSALQGSSSAFPHRRFSADDSHAERVRELSRAQVGDLVVVPGHVMMIVGHVNGEPYVIQDVPYAIFKDPASGKVRKTKLNQVSVTPLLPLLMNEQSSYVDAMTSLVHVTRP